MYTEFSDITQKGLWDEVLGKKSYGTYSQVIVYFLQHTLAVRILHDSPDCRTVFCVKPG